MYCFETNSVGFSSPRSGAICVSLFLCLANSLSLLISPSKFQRTWERKQIYANIYRWASFPTLLVLIKQVVVSWAHSYTHTQLNVGRIRSERQTNRQTDTQTDRRIGDRKTNKRLQSFLEASFFALSFSLCLALARLLARARQTTLMKRIIHNCCRRCSHTSWKNFYNHCSAHCLDMAEGYVNAAWDSHQKEQPDWLTDCLSGCLPIKLFGRAKGGLISILAPFAFGFNLSHLWHCTSADCRQQLAGDNEPQPSQDMHTRIEG